jgi:hypothetical protein
VVDPRRALVDDMQLALRSELGARTLYPLLRRRTSDPELRLVLERMTEDEHELVRRLGALIVKEGGEPRTRSFRRWLASWCIAAGTLFFGLRFALRLSQDAESAVARWYGTYCRYYLEQGDEGTARACDDLVRIKLRHAQWLETWVENSLFRRLGG